MFCQLDCMAITVSSYETKRSRSFRLFSLHKKWSFPSRISSVNLTKSTVSCEVFLSTSNYHNMLKWWYKAELNVTNFTEFLSKFFQIMYVLATILIRSSPREVFQWKGVLKICNKFTEHPCGSVISINLLCNFIEIILWHGYCPVNLLHMFRTPFRKSTSGGLVLTDAHSTVSINLTLRFCKNF